MKSFYSWIKQFKRDVTPIGDLARDMEYDKAFPKSKKRHIILSHLESLEASESAIDTFEEAFADYETFMEIVK